MSKTEAPGLSNLDEEAPAAETSTASESNGEAAPKETREEVLARHRKEIKALQGKEIELKKQAAKGSKAAQKAAKHAVDEQIAKLDASLKKRHAKELAALGFGEKEAESAEGKKPDDMDTLVRAIAGTSVGQQRGPSKAQKRRDAKMKQEVEREQRIQQEQSGVVSERVIENQRLAEKLSPLGLALKEIKPDGHCLYRAVEDQLQLQGQPSNPTQDYLSLRKLAAVYMRAHKDDFLPFVTEHATEHEGDPDAQFEAYCKEVEETATWGGQLELGALAQALRQHISVYSASLPVVEMGKEYERGMTQPLRLSYHQHAYGLGEHYNSVVSAQEEDE
eukprot:TRINITY_DN12685_c0_g1_i1.p1 TRINITY_DN12685_c0_g1~~TRINITY_DN12685_c0_g1_i1.p1  ORF type:complete len:334 (+),score=100.77 TRINITY_DN12685_c0_g1_i1:500-1501(+)